jgi:nickel-type superoxide dismutase maturation protease
MLRRLRAFLPFDRYLVEGESMLPTVQPDERVIVSRIPYWFARPKKGDLVVLRDPRESARLLLKRIETAKNDGTYSVVGDNAAASTDSRVFGAVPSELILGKVWFRY